MREFGDGVKLGEFSQSDPLDIRRESTTFAALKEERSVSAGERTDHGESSVVTRRVTMSRDKKNV